MDLVLNNLQRLICHKTQQTKPNQNYINAELDKTEMLMNLKKQNAINGKRILSRNMEYFFKKTKGISKHCRYFQN